MNFPLLSAMLAPSAPRVVATPLPLHPVLQAIRAVGDYADALTNGHPIDEAALAYARCVLEHGGCADLCDERFLDAAQAVRPVP